MHKGISFEIKDGKLDFKENFKPEEFRDDVQKLYIQYHDDFITYIPDEKEMEEGRRFYIYEWYTKDKGKIFYVGKGTENRYNHIVKDMRYVG